MIFVDGDLLRRFSNGPGVKRIDKKIKAPKESRGLYLSYQ